MAHGATVILNGRNREKIAEKVRELTKRGYRTHGSAFDVISSKEVNAATPAGWLSISGPK